MMNCLFIIVFLLLLIAVFAMFFKPDEHRQERSKKIRSLRSAGKMGQSVGRLRDRTAELLYESKIPRRALYFAMLGCGIGGFFAGKAVFSSTVISVMVGVLATLLPMALLSYRRTQIVGQWLEDLNSSMMVLSNSYVVTHDIITSIELNVDQLDYPGPFKDFLVHVKYVDPDVESGLRRIENKVGNAYMSQWIDAMVLAQKDRSLCYVTVAIVESMRDALAVQRETDAAMYAVWRNYAMVLCLIFAAPLVFRFLMPDAYSVLVTTVMGQFLFFLLLLSVALSVVLALRLNRPRI